MGHGHRFPADRLSGGAIGDLDFRRMLRTDRNHREVRFAARLFRIVFQMVNEVDRIPTAPCAGRADVIHAVVIAAQMPMTERRCRRRCRGII